MDMCFAAVGKAIFGQPEVAVGLVPGGGSAGTLHRAGTRPGGARGVR